MTDHLTDDELRRARKVAEAQFADLPHRDEDWEIAARAILAHVPDPDPAPLTEWSEDLRGTWVEDKAGSVYLLLDGDGGFVDVYEPDVQYKVGEALLSALTPRPDLAPVDLTPRPIEQEATPRTVTTAEEYAALPEGSIVALPGGRGLTKMGEGWFGTLGDGPHAHDSMAVATRELLREGWGE